MNFGVRFMPSLAGEWMVGRGVDGWKGRGLMKMMFGNGTHMIMLHILLPSIFSFFSSFLGSIGKHVRTEGADG